MVDFPMTVYASFPADSVEIEGRHIGVSQRMTYSTNAGAVLSKAIDDQYHPNPGTEGVFLWVCQIRAPKQSKTMRFSRFV